MRAFFFALILLIISPTAISCAGGPGTSEDRSSSSKPPETSSPTGSAQDPADRADDTTGGPTEATVVPQLRANAAARCYVDSVNAGDLDALVGCFSPDGAVVDVSRRIEGPDAVREWAGDEVMGGSVRVLEEEPRPNGTRLLVHWAPAGSDGWQAFYAFEVRDGRIVVADLQYA